MLCSDFDLASFEVSVDPDTVADPSSTLSGSDWEGARCSSVVRAFAHGAVGRRIDPSSCVFRLKHFCFFSFSVVTFEICVANRYKLDKKYRKLKAKSDDAQDDVLLKNTVAQAKVRTVH